MKVAALLLLALQAAAYDAAYDEDCRRRLRRIRASGAVCSRYARATAWV